MPTLVVEELRKPQLLYLLVHVRVPEVELADHVLDLKWVAVGDAREEAHHLVDSDVEV